MPDAYTKKNFNFSSEKSSKKLKKQGSGNKLPKDIDFSQLLSHFLAIQALHVDQHQRNVSDDVVTGEQADKLFEMKLSESENVEYSVIDE